MTIAWQQSGKLYKTTFVDDPPPEVIEAEKALRALFDRLRELNVGIYGKDEHGRPSRLNQQAFAYQFPEATP